MILIQLFLVLMVSVYVYNCVTILLINGNADKIMATFKKWTGIVYMYRYM